MRELIDVSWDGTQEFAHFDSDGNLIAIETTNDVTAVLESNLELRNDGSGGYGKTREWKRIADIPMSLIRVWEREMNVPHDFLLSKEGFAPLLKKVKDPDYKYLRTDK